jgi:death-on-curing protein
MTTDFYHTELLPDYERYSKVICEMSGDLSGCKVSAVDVLRAHYTIVDYFLEMSSDALAVGGIGPRDINLLISAVARQQASFSGINKWKDDYHLAATLTYGLVKDHAFYDCNKRTALLTCLYYLYIINQVPNVGQLEFERLMILIADNKLSSISGKLHVKDGEDFEVRTIAEFLKKNTRKSDKRQYQVTFNELKRILSRFSIILDNPKGNYIDVLKVDEKSSFFGLRKRIVETKLATIGFPGWTRKVYHKDIDILRKSAGLTPEKGYDSKVFFHGLDPLKVIVHDYSGPLRRLAKK